MAQYDVEKARSGSVTPPKCEVAPPDVKLGRTGRTITVPKVTTERRKIEVAALSVTPAPGKKQGLSTLFMPETDRRRRSPAKDIHRFCG